MDRKGNSVDIEARVVVAQDVPIQSLMWKGCLADWTGEGDVMEVVGKATDPDIKGRNYRRLLLLRRFRSALPDEGT